MVAERGFVSAFDSLVGVSYSPCCRFFFCVVAIGGDGICVASVFMLVLVFVVVVVVVDIACGCFANGCDGGGGGAAAAVLLFVLLLLLLLFLLLLLLLLLVPGDSKTFTSI